MIIGAQHADENKQQTELHQSSPAEKPQAQQPASESYSKNDRKVEENPR